MLRSVLSRASALLLVLTLSTLSACLLDPTEPGIVTMSITPSVISTSDTGMTDEYFTVEITVINFVDEIDAVTVFTQNPRVDAEPQNVVVEGNTIVLSGIAKSWFTDFEPGVHNIGATVESATATITENNLATVTIE